MADDYGNSPPRGIELVHLLLAIATGLAWLLPNLLTDDEELIVVAMLPWSFSIVTLAALHVVARHNKRRWLWLAVLPVAVALAVVGLMLCANSPSPSETPSIVAVLLAAAIIVLAVLGPWRFWNSRRTGDASTWQFGVRHLLVAMCATAIAATVWKYFSDQVLDASWVEIAVYVVNPALVAIACGFLVQQQSPRWWRLALAAGVVLAIGRIANVWDNDFYRRGGVRMNAIQLAIMTAWLWGPQLWERWFAKRDALPLP